jgi:hypothetical protein
MKATLQRLEFKRVGQGGYTEVRAMRWVDYNDLACRRQTSNFSKPLVSGRGGIKNPYRTSKLPDSKIETTQ